MTDDISPDGKKHFWRKRRRPTTKKVTSADELAHRNAKTTPNISGDQKPANSPTAFAVRPAKRPDKKHVGAPKKRYRPTPIPNSGEATGAKSKLPSNIQFPLLKSIRVGQPDANVEFYNSIKLNENPIYLDSFFMMPHFPMSEFLSGEKFIVYGQKGTGKTAALRYIENELKSKFSTEFIIFKRAFLEESDVLEISRLPLAVDEDEIKQFKHYHHAIKRVLIMIFLKKSFEKYPDSGGDGEFSEQNYSLLDKIKNSTIGDVVRLAFDSVRNIVESSKIDAGKITDEKVLLDAARALKRNNDDLLTFLCSRLKRLRTPIAVFLDEIHFAYRSEESLQQDAILVRDCLLAVHSLSDRFVEDGVDARLYAAVRAEYLEHPLISSADINHTIESVGFQLSWSTFAPDMYHPLFQLIFQRFKNSIGPEFQFRDFLGVYLKNIDIEDFIHRTWSKPRDFIRFFKCAKELYPERSRLTKSEANAVWRRYAQEAWNEIKSSASPFMSGPSIAQLESIFRQEIPEALSSPEKHTYDSFVKMMQPIYETAKGSNQNFYSLSHFLELLYILGIFGTRKKNSFGLNVIQTYHRGNRSFQRDGEVLFHPTILKAFG